MKKLFEKIFLIDWSTLEIDEDFIKKRVIKMFLCAVNIEKREYKNLIPQSLEPIFYNMVFTPYKYEDVPLFKKPL